MILNKDILNQKIAPAIPALEAYWSLLLKWQKTVNLISSKTIESGWNRHILDSAQLYFLIENQQHTLMDVGSGGGLPGIVIAILNKELHGPLTKIILEQTLSFKRISILTKLFQNFLNGYLNQIFTLR